eukprot:CAMPEP_0206605820 /NCGR_PEP_ID=MMETSP0325_2-20121206/50719_1 /ASSEMBLY_ACC=CAM_ASM_000347 /TAXON_ID=2866 /ORGANISM="Crypthecodinium cohnii, Strain Seligo" /LENGTH=484 /DNA_ID=CAMNT_0054121589 /DNA_START=23 /DNA_END=1477 /DNA_ORIENTATION=-
MAFARRHRGVSIALVGAAALISCVVGSAVALGGDHPKVEIVLAQYDEDISWSDPYKDVRTVYCKGSQCPEGSISLPNVGREGHTFLRHIVDRYDSLADWTVFSQAELPTEGYFGHGHGEKRGHLLQGISFEDYLRPSLESGSKLYLTSQVHAPSMKHSLRSTFQASQGQKMPQATSQRDVCPSTHGEEGDVWRNFQDMPQFSNFLSAKCNVEEHLLGEAVRTFWDQFLELELPEGGILQYAQGARFAVSKERILARPRSFYERLLETLSMDADPCINYIMEWAWYYIFAGTSENPCQVSGEILESVGQSSEARFLHDGGVSGEDLVTITGSIRLSAGTLDLAVLGEKAEETLMAQLNLDSSTATVSVEASMQETSSRRLQDTFYYLLEYTITLSENGYDYVQDILTVLEPGTVDGNTFLDAFGDNLGALLGTTITPQSMTTPIGSNIPTTTSETPPINGSERAAVGLLACLIALATLSPFNVLN